jgi:hypothetical protein
MPWKPWKVYESQAAMKRILTVADIREMAAQGQKDLEITNDTIITDVAREQAEKLGISIKKNKGVGGRYSAETDLRQEVRKAVLARLGSVPENLDALIDTAINDMKRGH